MAPAVESTDTDKFRRSHSVPDLFLQSTLAKQLAPHSMHNCDHRHTPGTDTPGTSPVVPKSTTLDNTRAPGAAGIASPTLISSTQLANTSLSSASPRSPSALSTTSIPSSPTVLSSKSLPSLPAFDVPSFDFDVDLDTELEFSVLGRQKKTLRKSKPLPPSVPPRRLWEQFIKPPDASKPSSTAASSSSAIEGEPKIQATVVAPLAGADNSHPVQSMIGLAACHSDGNLTNDETRQNGVNQRPATAITPSTQYEAAIKDREAAPTERLSRRKTLDRPLSWISTSHSTPDFRELLLKERQKEARKARGAAAANATTGKYATIARPLETATLAPLAAASAPAPQAAGDKMTERQRTVSASSFVDFARRSWISRSPSPSSRKVPSKKDSREDAPRASRFSRRRPLSTVFLSNNINDTGVSIGHNATAVIDDSNVDSLAENGPSPLEFEKPNDSTDPASADAPRGRRLIGSGAKVRDRATPAPAAAATGAAAVVAPAPPSRTFSRASGYLSRMKQRPQSMFGKTTVAPTASPAIVDFETTDDHGDVDDRAPVDSFDGSSVAPLPLSLDLLSNRSDDTVVGVSKSKLDQLPQGRSSSSSNNSNSDDSSSDDSANGSALHPTSEVESLTTADTSNHNSSMAHPNSRDPHWVAFKDLETNFFKFLSKTTTAQRMDLVRNALLPFLRRYAIDGSSKNTSQLTPEDVERRTSILDRWWTGLLEMLDGPCQWSENFDKGSGGYLFAGGAFFNTSTTANGNFQPVSGVDRPVVLEAVSMIMSRPEWRLLTTVFRPLADRSPAERVRARANTSDTPQDEPAIFVEESAEHNVRTMFVNNLLAQLILVVDRMGMRQAPLSIVNFSGKAAAYAFFFVPGVADILIRLWGLDRNIDLVRRAADAVGLPRRSRGESDDLVALFPPCIGPLGWSSVSAMQAKLRRAPKMCLLPPAYVSACSRISWFAPCWLSRWRGSDTDLLFIFCKYYHVLADEFMPRSLQLPLVEKARAPGFVLLHAQLLQIFDNTIHRQAAVEAAMLMAGTPMGDGMPSLWTQEQMQQQRLSMPTSNDSCMPALMMQPHQNLFREMEENRIIALLRDLLNSDESLAGARDTFARTTMVLLKAATLRTSQYDHSACYILCDFLNEILQAFDGYYGYRRRDSSDSTVEASPTDYIDWVFWLDICKRILDSNNTMSEIRILSFIFSTWDIVAADPGRKEELCVGWLLTEDVFYKFFNNWCPLVRAYYMRLVCWRMCRDRGSPNELDAKIFLLASQRLKTVWAHYLWLKQKAVTDGTSQPSTTPSLPQPGKCFRIVRTEIDVPQLGLLANANDNGGASGDRRATSTFDALASSISGVSLGGTNATGNDVSGGSSSDKKIEGGSAKKKWSLLGKVLSLTTKPPTEEEFEQMRRDGAFARAVSRSGRLGSPSSESVSSTGSTPVFDAAQVVFRFALHNIQWQTSAATGEVILPPAYRERVLTRPRLPAPAQARVSARLAASGWRSESPPPPAPGLPPINRRVSGLATGGLINAVRNAGPDDDAMSIMSGRSGSMSISSRPSFGYHRDSFSSYATSGEWDRGRSDSPFARAGSLDIDFDRERERERIVEQPQEPKGQDMLLRAKYAGRALAEWGLVVSECNSFVDRRRGEGVYGLKDVEVPMLAVDGMRRLC